uniref:heme oxygenase (biliverdin-producing) n=1 Tax=Spermophilus dauricus TaxID=99837 RepID=A0A8C9QD31_SPEDA
EEGKEGGRRKKGSGGGEVDPRQNHCQGIKNHSATMSAEVETSEGVDESEKKNSVAPEKENHTRMADLSELHKEGTIEFVKDFLKGNIKKELFKLATTALYFTYSALGEEMDRHKDHPAFAHLYFPTELHRKEALTKDMEYFFGENWEELVKCSEAAQKYVERIHYIGQNEPELLVAHAYTHYMGDLSGGQVLKKVAQPALKLPSTGEGTQFYLFKMNALDLNLKTKERIVEEANKAFEYKAFNELDQAGSALARETLEDGLPGHVGKEDVPKCPFYAAQQDKGALEGSSCPFRTAMAVLRKPSLQFVLAAAVALAAGLLAWYYM